MGNIKQWNPSNESLNPSSSNPSNQDPSNSNPSNQDPSNSNPSNQDPSNSNPSNQDPKMREWETFSQYDIQIDVMTPLYLKAVLSVEETFDVVLCCLSQSQQWGFSWKASVCIYGYK